MDIKEMKLLYHLYFRLSKRTIEETETRPKSISQEHNSAQTS